MRHLCTGTNHVIVVAAIVLFVAINTAAADDLEFVCIPQEATLLMYEEWSFYFMAINNTAFAVSFRPLNIDDQCISYRISDAYGNVLDHPNLTAEYAPGAFREKKPAHDTARGYATIVYDSWGPNVDSVTGLATIEPGEYTIEFIWLYDPDARAIYGGSRFLYDTAHVTVIMPSGPDSLAMDMYVKANADCQRVYEKWPAPEVRGEASVERNRRYLEIVEAHPTSCFARMALEKVISSASGGDQPEFEGYRLSELTAIYVLRYPERPFAQAALRTLARARFIPGSEKKRVLGKIAYTLDQSEIGRLAETLSIDPYEGRKRR